MKIDEMYNVISDNVRYYRFHNLKYGHVTQEQLSRISKVSLSLIRSMELKGKNRAVNLIALNHIANALDIPLYLFFIRI